MKKQYFIVLDTETANSVAFPLPYDFGWSVTDRHGNIIRTFSFVLYEIYCKRKDLMKSAYYADKIPQYEADIKAGKRKLVSIWTARKAFFECVKEYDVSAVYAYNMGFDRRALNNDIKLCSSWLSWFFPKDIEFKCIWNMACTSILNRKSYIKFATENNYISKKGNILTNAEVCYRYITKNNDFKESHTGLEDVLIETAILAYCFRQHKKFDDSVNSACWRKVQKKRDELQKTA